LGIFTDDNEIDKFASIFLAGMMPTTDEDDMYLASLSYSLNEFSNPIYGENLFNASDPCWSTTMAADSQYEHCSG
jgi:hypothetical protein